MTILYTNQIVIDTFKTFFINFHHIFVVSKTRLFIGFLCVRATTRVVAENLLLTFTITSIVINKLPFTYCLLVYLCGIQSIVNENEIIQQYNYLWEFTTCHPIYLSKISGKKFMRVFVTTWQLERHLAKDSLLSCLLPTLIHYRILAVKWFYDDFCVLLDPIITPWLFFLRLQKMTHKNCKNYNTCLHSNL